MKLRKCLLWQTQRPSIGITSRAWNVDTIRDGLSGHLRGNAASDGSRYTPLTVFLDAKKKYKGKEGKQLERFHGIHRKIRGTVNVAQQAGWQYLPIYRYSRYIRAFLSWRGKIFIARDSYIYTHVWYFSHSSKFLRWIVQFIQLSRSS